jgi:hypothetical protein
MNSISERDNGSHIISTNLTGRSSAMQIFAIIGWIFFAVVVVPLVISVIMAIPDMIRYMRIRRM